ncbi:hypothetical protein ACHAXS_008446 [Conticribra weissflogii]
MSSWFTSTTLADLKNKVQSSVTSLTNDPDLLLSKLTLSSPELTAERDKIDSEEKRKEQVKDALAEILPWETRDQELEILVEECKEVILGLSSDEGTFTGPFVLVGGLPSGGVDGEAEEDEDDEGGRNVDGRGGKKGGAKTSARDLEAAQQSADKLSKLQPLPALLSNFDLDTHVGLIQRLFKEDKKLVEMHSRLSSGGEKEVAFWKNYFFHCAYARYEAGLSIDEIWSSEHNGVGSGGYSSGKMGMSSSSSPSSYGKTSNEGGEYNPDDTLGSTSQDEEEVTFDSSSVISKDSSSKDKKVVPTASTDNSLFPSHSAVTEKINASAPAKPVIQGKQDTADSYEFVSDNGGNDDGSMDELEAEIAAALGD